MVDMGAFRPSGSTESAVRSGVQLVAVGGHPVTDVFDAGLSQTREATATQAVPAAPACEPPCLFLSARHAPAQSASKQEPVPVGSGVLHPTLCSTWMEAPGHRPSSSYSGQQLQLLPAPGAVAPAGPQEDDRGFERLPLASTLGLEAVRLSPCELHSPSFSSNVMEESSLTRDVLDTATVGVVDGLVGDAIDSLLVEEPPRVNLGGYGCGRVGDRW